MFDEPSSYLDVKQRLNAARVIRTLLGPDTYVIVVEHDLSVLDYLSDFICCLYGKPSVYGVVTLPYSVREGINIFLEGNIPTENLRFREESLSFKIAETAEEFVVDKSRSIEYPAMSKTLGNFQLDVHPGKFSDSEIIVLVGENGTGECLAAAFVLRLIWYRKIYLCPNAGGQAHSRFGQATTGHDCLYETTNDCAQVPRHRQDVAHQTNQSFLPSSTIPGRRHQAYAD